MRRVIGACAGALALAFTAHSALAADMPRPITKAPAMVAAPLFNWSGFYVGGTVGYGWGDTEHIQRPVRTGDFDLNGWAAGATLGVNWQFAGSWVFGLETDFSWSGIDAALEDGIHGTGFGCDPSGCKTEVKWFGTARARLGPTFGPLFPYLTGGFAYGRVHAEISGFPGPVFNGSETTAGWAAGAGVEYAFAPAWSAKLEYLFVDLGEITYGKPDGGFEGARATADFHLVRFGLNYRFATGKMPGKAPLAAPAVVTKY